VSFAAPCVRREIPKGHVYGKFGGSPAFSETKVVVLHGGIVEERARDLRSRKRLNGLRSGVESTRAGWSLQSLVRVLYAKVFWAYWRQWHARHTP